jgi:TonB-linked SusC/RagA family outer membrane protein
MEHFRQVLFSVILLLISPIASAQNISVSGIVKDANGNEIIGATVMVKGTSNGTVTDMDGHFSLNVKQGATLVITYVGMKSQEVKAGSDLKIVMKDETNDLNEVVVTGYTAQRKADLTGAVSVVSTDAFRTTPDADPMRALQGKVAGMTITTTGSPSGTATVRIRGIGSFNSSQDPLYVIDGVPMASSLNTLNANDIESMQVLKDAASASIYGSRAANGVIIITTKKGNKDGRTDINFSANVTTSFYTNQSKMKLLDTKGYATAMTQAALNDGLDPEAYANNYGLTLKATQGIGIKVWDPSTSSYQNYIVNGLYGGYINSKKTMGCSDTDWVNVISHTGMSQNYNVSISHATDKQSSLFSVGLKDNSGILKYTYFKSIEARMNESYNFNRYISVGENFSLSYNQQVDSSPMEDALKMAPIVPVYEINGTTFSGPVGGMSDRQNPLREEYQNKDNHLDYWHLFGNVFLDIHLIKGMTFRSNFGIEYVSSFINSLTHTYSSDIVNNNIAKTDLGQTNNTNYTWSNTLNYLFNINKKHKFNILLGSEINKQSSIDFHAISEGYTLETIDYMWPNAATGTMRNSGAKVGYRLASFFEKAEYNYEDLLLASFTMRHDGSSRFGKKNRWGNFPAASLGFRVSQLLNKKWIEDLKLRFSWGITGNQGIDNNAHYGLYVADYGLDRVTSTAYDLTLAGSGTFPSGYRATQTENDNLKWESTTQYNLGLDYTLFGNQLYGTIDAYIKNINNMLINPAYLGSMGEGGSTWSNGPSLRDWGMEFTAGYRMTLLCGLGLNIRGDFDFYRNRVTSLPTSTTGSYAHTTTQNLVQAHKPYGSIVGYVADGLYQSENEVLASGQASARVGGMKYKDLNGDGVINENDETWIFNPVPDFSYGLNVQLNYKNFDFTMFWQGVARQDVYNGQKAQTDFWSITDAGSNKGSRLLRAWTKDNTSSTIPALTTNNTADENRISSYFVENGSYLKLRTLQIGYNLPRLLAAKIKMESARVYVSGQNLLTIKSNSLTCSDPENPNWNYPIATSVSFGLQIGF